MRNNYDFKDGKKNPYFDSIYYILEGKNIVPCDMFTWAKFFENSKNRTICVEEINNIKISTVFLGLDHGWGSDIPVLFETMVFGGALDGEMERYHTYDEAEEGHKKMVDRVRENK